MTYQIVGLWVRKEWLLGLGKIKKWLFVCLFCVILLRISAPVMSISTEAQVETSVKKVETEQLEVPQEEEIVAEESAVWDWIMHYASERANLPPRPVEPIVVYEYEYVDVIVSEVPVEDLGTFTIRAYCPCNECRGTPRGTQRMTPRQNITIATNEKDIAYGTLVYIDGVGIRLSQSNDRIVQRNVIEVYFRSHSAVEAFEESERRVFLVAQGTNS
jgi:3D (Asp-Asp-Asp) domain-containing protein